MSGFELQLDQASFTSLRTAMGEGYRIVACSKKLRPDEKQTITRNSPSHEALTEPQNGAAPEPAVSFFALPTGRLCLGLSSAAGAEHTGRGGLRVYTRALVFAKEDFARCMFNPFLIVRSAITAGLASPDFGANGVLPELRLPVDLQTRPNWRNLEVPGEAIATWVDELLHGKSMVIHSDRPHALLLESLICCVPGPMRASISLAHGVKYSAARQHRLQAVFDPAHAARTRASGQRAVFVDSTNPTTLPPVESTWLRFVARLWTESQWEKLFQRTSTPLADASLESRERIGRWFNVMDEADQLAPDRLIASLSESWSQRQRAGEEAIADQLRNVLLSVLERNLASMDKTELGAIANRIRQLGERGPEARKMMEPLIRTMEERNKPAAEPLAAFPPRGPSAVKILTSPVE